MAYNKIYQRWSSEWFFVADGDADVSTIASENPDAPIGSVIIALNAGSPKTYMKGPAGTFYALN